MFRNIIRKIDTAVFGGRAVRFYRRMTQENFFEDVNARLGYRFVVHYKKDRFCALSELCDKYGSDKGETGRHSHPYNWPSHMYANFYARVFRNYRRHVKSVFECGIGTNNPFLESSMGATGRPGASLRIWREYFQNAQIIGADIDRDILFEEERIKTYHVDQMDPSSICALWNNVGRTEFDIMIDDGLHTFEAGKCLFENSIRHLSEEGIYIIEDVDNSDLLKFIDYFSEKCYDVDYVNLLGPNREMDYNLVLIRKINGNAL
jgi:hypothetical protein